MGRTARRTASSTMVVAMLMAASVGIEPVAVAAQQGTYVRGTEPRPGPADEPQVPPALPTVEDFDGTHSPYLLGQHVIGEPTVAAETVAEAGNTFLRLAKLTPPPQNNSIAFDRTSAGSACGVRADFDFRMTPTSTQRADGMGFTLLNTGALTSDRTSHGTFGIRPPQGPLFAAEEPNFSGSLGIGFDIHRRTDPPADPDANHISVHFNGAQVGVQSPTLDLASGSWIHATVTVSAGSAQSTVSVSLAPPGGPTIHPFTDFVVPAMKPYESRALFGGRSGFDSALHDLDNINIAFTRCAASAAGPASELGQWGAILDFRNVAIHAHLLANGKVMLWDRSDYNPPGNTTPLVWDPGQPTVPPVPLADPGYDLFCTGHTFLADGRLLAVGGHTPYIDLQGLPTTAAYDPPTNTWKRLADMNRGRWYPSAAALANGDVLTVEGTYWSGAVDPQGNHVNFPHNTLPQVLSRRGGGWVDLPNAQLELGLYPYLYLAPDGRAFSAGPQAQSRFLNTTTPGQWVNGPVSSQSYRDYGTSAMYGAGKVLIAGGSVNDGATALPSNSAEVVDLVAGGPWAVTTPMGYARKQHTATLLPDGTVLVTGGTDRPGLTDARGSVLIPELWDPATGMWSKQAAMQVPRNYHSTALLLPDARVLVAGGGHPRDATHGDPDHPNAEIYSPSYLFRGARPTISSAPTSVTYGQSFAVGTPDAAGAARVTWVRLGSVTHGFNQSQRINDLGFTAAGGALQVRAPSDPRLSPPGHYMLFVMNAAGVPSVARIVRIDGRTQVADFDASATTDVSVFRPSNGIWFVRGEPAVPWGTSGDDPVPADYDGDGDAEMAVFRPASGTWYVRGGATVNWGASGDRPVPADYDRDGKADIAVFRPATGTWFMRGGESVNWGTSTDVAVPGDYDGDNDADAAVFRPSTGTWYVRGSPAVNWGTSGDIPVPGDYDGDGDTDMAVFRNGTWYVRGSPSVNWGTAGDIPVPGDYDGDGYTDIAVFRNGTWFVRGGPSVTWGITGDIALPTL